MDIIVWGAGIIGEDFVATHQGDKIAYIIDNDYSKMGRTLQNYRICHPSRVDFNERMFIVVAVKNHSEIVEQLINLGLVRYKNFVMYDEYISDDFVETLTDEIDDFIKRISTLPKNQNIVFSHFLFDRTARQMVDFWNYHNSKCKDIFLLCDSTKKIPEEVIRSINFGFLYVPIMLRKIEIILRTKKQINIDKTIPTYVQSKRSTVWLYNNLMEMYPEAEESVCSWIAFCSEYCINKVLDIMEPRTVTIFNSFRTWHYLLRCLCEEKHITMNHCEFGPIEGTFQFDNIGLMGETYPCLCSEEFDKLKISRGDIQKAREVMEYMFNSKINRYAQPKGNVVGEINTHFEQRKPVVIYIGQNDYEAGINPYTIETQEKHSPSFSSSSEAANYLYELCERCDLNFVYKPHPAMMNIGSRFADCTEGMYILESGDINDVIDIADVIITINSTVAYAALIRKKATILLGYMQLSHHNCCYECYNKEDIEDTINEALVNGLRDEMQKAFIEHVARMLKYYLYDTHIKREMPYGKRDMDIY